MEAQAHFLTAIAMLAMMIGLCLSRRLLIQVFLAAGVAYVACGWTDRVLAAFVCLATSLTIAMIVQLWAWSPKHSTVKHAYRFLAIPPFI